MALYKYLAAAKGEQPHDMLIEADNEKEALSKLRSRHVMPVRFYGEVSVGGGGRLMFRRSRIDTYDFTRQLAPLLDSFIPLEKALGIIAKVRSNRNSVTLSIRSARGSMRARSSRSWCVPTVRFFPVITPI